MRMLDATVAIAVLAVCGASCGASVIDVPAVAPTIQAGINAAAPGDTVLVAPGTYSGEGFRSIDFGGKNLVVMSSGGSGATEIVCTHADTCFFLHSGEDTTAVIEGFTIEAAETGFALEDAAVRITECRTERCGDAVSAVRSGAVVRGCSFVGQSTASQNGVSCAGLPGLTIRDCFFSHVFVGIGAWETELTVRGCEFYRVFGFNRGSALTGERSDLELYDIVVEECGPTSAFTWIGAAFYLDGCNVLLDDAVFVRNGIWGAMDRQGVIVLSRYWTGLGRADIRNAVFFDNDVGSLIWPGSIQSSGQRLVVESTTVVFDDGISVAYCDSARVERTVVAFGYRGIVSDIGDALTTIHSCVFGNTYGDSLPGTHYDNLFVDPLFCDTGGDDFTLHDDSPCLPANNPWGVQIGALGAGGCGTDVPENDGPVSRFRLHRASPNPAAGPVSLAFDVPVAGRTVEIVIYNAAGEVVRRLEAMPASRGRHAVVWDGRSEDGLRAAAGGYFVRATCGDAVSRTTLVLVR